MLVTCKQMQQLEEKAFARGVQAEELMEEAGMGIAEVVMQFFQQPGTLVLCLGRGNNAGDALVAARILAQKGWSLTARLAYSPSDFKPLPLAHWEDLAGRLLRVDELSELAGVKGNLVILDGLVGIGGQGKLRPELAQLVEEMNELRQRRHASVVALDLPSGLGADDGVPGSSCVKADLTIAIAHAKTGLVADAAVDHVGRLAVVPLAELAVGEREDDFEMEVLTSRGLLPKLPCRDFDFHKGQAGRVGIAAGSKGMVGAAVLAARGALHGGAGLVTVYAKEEIYPLLTSLMPVEVMVKPVSTYEVCLEDRLDVLVMGPGLGLGGGEEIRSILRRCEIPVVLDADGLNAVAENGAAFLDEVRAPMLLTPHPGEMARLVASVPEWGEFGRAELARHWVERFPLCQLLLKGSRTVIAAKAQALAFNTTGTPGMASGGMGDVLSGLCGALIAQGVTGFEAACLGAWLSGRAAEIALTQGEHSQESLSAGEVAACLGPAFSSLKALDY